MGDIQREGSEAVNGGQMTTLGPHAIGASEAVLAENTDPRELRGAKTRNGRTQYSIDNGSGTGVKGIRAWTRDAGTAYVVARTGTTFYDVQSAAWASIGIGGTDSARFQASPLNNVLAIVVDGMTPSKWDGTTFAVLSGSPPSEAKYAAVYSSKLFLAGDDANPQTLSFSATNNPDDWTATNDAGTITTQEGGGDTIQGVSAARKWMCIFYRNFVDILIGNSVFNFAVERLIDRGLVSTTGHATAGDINFFASDDAIYMVAGAKAVDITTGKIKDTYQGISDKSQISLGIKGDLLLVVDYGNDKAYACYYKKLIWAEWTDQEWEVMDTANDQTFYAGTDTGSTTQVWKIDTGSLDGTSSVTAAWRTPNFAFGWPDATKNLAAMKVHAKPGMPTMTLTYYADGASIGSQNTLTFASTGDNIWGGVTGQRAVRGTYLGVKMSWTGPGTLYGYAMYAEVTTTSGPIPQIGA